MSRFVSIFIVVLFFTGLVSSFATSAGRYIGAIAELMSAVLMIVIVLRIAAHKMVALKPRYIVLAVLVVFHVLAGLLINSVSPVTVITGLRPYLKWLPLFLLPAVYHFSHEQISRQLKLILFLALLQCPVALYQRFFQFQGIETGDVITGTLGANASGALSLLLLSTIAVLTGFYERRQIRLMLFIFLVIVLMIPATINETKVTLFLIPIVFVVPLIVGSKSRLTGSKLVGAIVAVTVLMVGFVTIYRQFQPAEMTDLTSSKDMQKYLYSEKRTEEISLEKLRDNKIIGIIRQNPKPIFEGVEELTMLLPIRTLSEDPVRLWTGLGIGNTSSSFGNILSGDYSRRIGKTGVDLSISLFLWETGIGGALLFLWFLIMVFRDTYSFSAEKNYIGVFASGWVAVVLVTIVSLIYMNLLFWNVLIFLFAYFSGYFVAEHCYVDRRSGPQLSDSSLSGYPPAH